MGGVRGWARVSSTDALEAKDLGVVAEEPAAKVEDSPCDGRKIPDL